MRMLRKAGEAYGLLGQSLLKNVRVRDNIIIRLSGNDVLCLTPGVAEKIKVGNVC